MEELSVDNILSGDELEGLFDGESTEQDTPPVNKEEGEKTTTEEDVDPNDLFTSEGVGSGETQTEEMEKPDSEQDDGSSPNDFYLSIANACKEEGIFPDLDDESLKNIKTADDFKEAMNKQVQAMLDEKQRRIDEALEYGVEPEDVQRYQGALNYLEELTDESLKDEGDNGLALRKQLIYNDYLNKGFSEERARKYTQRSFDQGTDVEDAIEARNSNKEYYTAQYSKLVEEAKEQAEAEAQREKEKAESIRKAIIETEEPFEGVKLDKVTRQRVFETISKPVYKDKDGNMYTALQKAQHDDETGFIQKLGYLFTLTDGFKNLDGLVKGKVQKETKRGFQKIERVLRTPPTLGEPRFASGVGGIDEAKSNELILDI